MECGVSFEMLKPGNCPFPSQHPDCEFAPRQWVPGGHIADEFAEKERTVHLDVEFKVFGAAQHVEKMVAGLDRLLELHGYRDAWINVRPDD